MALTLWVVFTVSFFLMRAVPGGPFSEERKIDPYALEVFEARYNLDEPLPVQYWLELKRTVWHGDLGLSIRKVDYTVAEIIAEGLPISATLGIVAMAFALTLGITAGVVSSVRRGTVLDFSLMTVATVGIALPNFVVAGIAIVLVVFIWPIFPAAGWGGVQHVILPAFCLGAPYAAYIARLVRTGMLDVLGQDYIRTAYAKGLMPRRVIMRHAMKGAMLPVASFLGPAVAGILTGSLIIEQIFAIPGLAYNFVQAAVQRDYTVAMGLVLTYTTLLYTMNLLVDISYSYLDPRVKLE
ncbi:MAG: ABC transporter permease [Planctomycetes bacterium]|nr:ABC transporter permease [Planctomycetota bacterium]